MSPLFSGIFFLCAEIAITLAISLFIPYLPSLERSAPPNRIILFFDKIISFFFVKLANAPIALAPSNPVPILRVFLFLLETNYRPAIPNPTKPKTSVLIVLFFIKFNS